MHTSVNTYRPTVCESISLAKYMYMRLFTFQMLNSGAVRIEQREVTQAASIKKNYKKITRFGK